MAVSEVTRRCVRAALHLLKPFILEGSLEVNRVGIYRYTPVHSRNLEAPPIIHETPIKGPKVLEATTNVVEGLLRKAEDRWRTLYEIHLVIEVIYSPKGSLRIPLYLLASNSGLGVIEIELESYDWVHEGRVVETLEESLKIVGRPTIMQLLNSISRVNRDLQEIGLAVERAVIAKTPDALNDITLAVAAWLPSGAKLLSYAIDTLATHRNDYEVGGLYDYYQPYRRNLVVTLLGNRREFMAYLLSSSRIRGVAEVMAPASLIIVSRSGTLKDFFDILKEDVLKPYAEHVLERGKTVIVRKAREFASTTLQAKIR